MTDDIQATRLGDILLEKGLIDLEQLREAIVEQRRRRQEVDPDDTTAMDATSLGEMLIELGHISRQQLKRGLNWQMYARKMTLVMSLCAPLMTWMGNAYAGTSNNHYVPDNTLTAAASCFKVTGRVILKWDVPRYREDGSYLDITELGGYELRYKRTEDNHFTYVSINDPWKNYYQFRYLQGDYVIQVAAFDHNGLYSQFVPLPPTKALA
ncbi:fibronectin type III domain-containing protein [Cellvibrio japonicus]|uniref:Uncharacterized protein n=1 Tax=Cellvibrio japonicus (strain Ueda107) TaxID=498211 RepID=B3PG48_CELJU|nr:fibronectin type III domain-containing protein [Cellvibrio japonicus]ACE85664.1 hypothetical protein CJA_3502 [Cellvibrio japonicus Ueda107]QEI13726.1 hypothetical protein FY117_16910 [Cellvibrio japonicus]QEI17300.1 hypothetical protein FY116_16915 [Cellvibrio japonicus]QEI20877.1 hypothetical protein FY115_16910 [Cellvibrio japonicus]